jgi:heat shock protein HslJ
MHRILILLIPLLFFSCASPQEKTAMKGTYWSLVELYEEEPELPSNTPPMHLIFHLNDHSVHGNDGCNAFKGVYHVEKNSLKFTQLLSTRKFCADIMHYSDNFLKALAATQSFQIQEQTLSLLDEKQNIIVEFEAQQAY